MTLLKKAVYEQAYLKCGGLGFMGSGKTTTAAYVAMGLAKEFGDGKPVAYFDTENGSDFLIPKFETEGLELQNVKSKAFIDLLSVVPEAEASCSVLVVDSLSAVWKELGTAYKLAVQKRKHLAKPPSRLSMQDWGQIKDTWEPWPTAFLNSRLHIIALGRAGYEWDEIEDEEGSDGEKKLIKTGTKMKVEGEFGYEPNFVFEMQRIPAEQSSRSTRNKPGLWAHRAIVLKDRTDSINGQQFDFQKPRKTYKAGDYKQVYEKFRSVWDVMKRSHGAQRAIDQTRTSESMFSGPSGESAAVHRARQVSIALEEIKENTAALWPGSDNASKRCRQALMEALFGTLSWTAVEHKSLEDLQSAVAILKDLRAHVTDGTPVSDHALVLGQVELAKERLRAVVENAVL